MEKCSVHKFRGTLNTAEPRYYGAVMLDLRNLSSSNTMYIVINPTSTITVIDSLGNTTQISSSGQYNFPGGRRYDFKNAESIKTFDCHNSMASYRDDIIMDAAQMSNATTITIGGKIEYVPINSVAQTIYIYPNLNELDTVTKSKIRDWVMGCPVTSIASSGEIFTMYDFGKFNLTYISAASHQNERVEDFVAMRRKMGATTGSLTWDYIPQGCTFNGSVIQNRTTNGLSWTATTITFGGVTIDNSEIAP